MKIVNIKKFLRSIIIIGAIIIALNIFSNNITLSHKDISYKEVYVSVGDTLWELAREESENNLYYSDKDIRYIVKDIKKINSMSNSNLSAGQKLIIPSI